MEDGNIFSPDGERTGEEGRTERKRDSRREKGGKGMKRKRRRREWRRGNGGEDRSATKGGRARKGEMTEERKGNKKMWSQGRNCRRGTWPHWKGKYVIVLQEATYDRFLEHVLISRWRGSNGWPPGSGG